MTRFLVLDDAGRELVTTPAVEVATWIMNRHPDAVRVETDGGVLIATRQMLNAPTVAAWFQTLGRYTC